MRILIAEDDAVSRKALESVLAQHGECYVAEDGESALTAFADAWGHNAPFDLICLDIMMPRLSGLEVLKAIRSHEEEAGLGGLAGVKVIMTTAMEGKNEVLGAFRLGCEGYILKPIDVQELLSKIAEFGLRKVG